MGRISGIGTIIKDRYCIIEKIGQGGEGSLYLAKDMELGTFWAIKVIAADRKKEVRFLTQLEHPGLPRMVDYAEQGEACYLVMEYIRGKSLGELLRQGKEFDKNAVIKIGTAAAEILDYLHDQKPPVYYGDLKPDNLMLGLDGNLYLVDLGSAVCGYESWGRGVHGTPGYAAPEQYEGKVGKTSDVYALGRTLKVLLGKKRWICCLRSPALARCLAKCCRKRERLRYQDMKSLKKALEKSGRGRRKEHFAAAVCGALVSMLLIVAVALSQKKVSLLDALSEYTGEYYSAAFLQARGDSRGEICRKMDEKLQKLLMEYRDAGEQKKILLLLAMNGELMGEMERAALYYEQLLLYYPGEVQGYAEYGLFLCRQGQKEASGLLWKKYCEEKKKGVVEESEEDNFRRWEKEVEDG